MIGSCCTCASRHGLVASTLTLRLCSSPCSFSSVPYEKGFFFLLYLCKVAGGFEAFDPFFKEYIRAFSFKTVTSEARVGAPCDSHGTAPHPCVASLLGVRLS
jgi:hypothetical protein